MKPTNLMLSSYHEAAHACVAMYFGLAIKHVRIRIGDNSFCEVARDSNSTIENIMISVAGAAGEALAGGRGGEMSPSDIELARASARELGWSSRNERLSFQDATRLVWTLGDEIRCLARELLIRRELRAADMAALVHKPGSGLWRFRHLYPSPQAPAAIAKRTGSIVRRGVLRQATCPGPIFG
jgi:hypothetical protein